MKAVKVVLISIFLILVAAYLAFLFVLPNYVNLDNYSPQISKIIQDNTGFQVELKGLKLKTDWKLSAGAFIDKTDLKDSSGNKFAQIDGLRVNVSLIPMIFGQVCVNKVIAEKVLANIEMMQRCKDAKMQSFSFLSNMPRVNVKKYRISFLNGQSNYTFKGENLKISDFILNKEVKIKTDGNLILNKRKQISYDVDIFAKNLGQKNPNTDFMKIMDDLYKYNVNAEIKADLKINKDTDINGNVNVEKVYFTFEGKTYPPSNLKLVFKGDKAKVNASLHVNNQSKAILTGLFKTGKRKNIDLNVITDKINIHDVLLIAKAMARPFGIVKLQDINADGFLKANFNIKSDFKKIQSSGYLKVFDASLVNKLHNISLASLNADIDFSQDAVKINQAKAKLNTQPISIKGRIDKNADANISVLADNLQLKGVLLAAGKGDLLKENDINGTVNIKAFLKGRLDKASPAVNAFVNNISLKNYKTKTHINIQKTVINLLKDKGRAEITALKIVPEFNAVISAPKLNLDFDKKDLNIEKTYLYINNIRTNLSGKISGIDSSPRLNAVNISIPNQVSVPIQGYAGSSILIKGNLILSGEADKPEIRGRFEVPLINIPTRSTVLKNAVVNIDKTIQISCPYLRMADSSANFEAQALSKDGGIIVQNLNFNADMINLNTLIPLLNELPAEGGMGFTVVNGKNNIKSFKTGSLVSSNISSDISFKNNVLSLNNLSAIAYLGEIKGSTGYDFRHKKTMIELKGRNLTSNLALSALTGRNDDIHGILDFDSDISMSGFSKTELLKTLKGETKFVISNGKMGVLGKFEHLIYAQNIISNNVFKTSLNLIAKALSVKNTGVYKYMKGIITFSNGWANILSIKTSGPSMSMYVTGRVYLPDNTASLIILGRISDDVVKVLGPIGEFSVNKAVSSIPKIGEITSSVVAQYTTNPSYENISEIPDLTPKTQFHTKEFKVVIDGNIDKQTSVKSFKWLSTPQIVQSQEQQGLQVNPKPAEVPEFVKNLPDFKN